MTMINMFILLREIIIPKAVLMIILKRNLKLINWLCTLFCPEMKCYCHWILTTVKLATLVSQFKTNVSSKFIHKIIFEVFYERHSDFVLLDEMFFLDQIYQNSKQLFHFVLSTFTSNDSNESNPIKGCWDCWLIHMSIPCHTSWPASCITNVKYFDV
jgi:hypothetical protein